jgi:hypothetical protein
MAHFRVAGDETSGCAPDYHVATDDACGRILGLPTGGLRREFDWPATPAGRFGIGAKPHGNSVCAIGASVNLRLSPLPVRKRYSLVAGRFTGTDGRGDLELWGVVGAGLAKSE